jgi:hypothetical protein
MKLIHVADLLKHFSGEGEKTLIFGNGVIASMTSHLVDLTKMPWCVVSIATKPTLSAVLPMSMDTNKGPKRSLIFVVMWTIY